MRTINTFTINAIITELEPLPYFNVAVKIMHVENSKVTFTELSLQEYYITDGSAAAITSAMWKF